MASTMSADDIDAAIIGYLLSLDKNQKAAVLNIIKAFAPMPEARDHWDDPDFVAEMDRQLEDYKSGKVNCVPWEEVKTSAEAAIEDVRKSKAKH